MPALSVPQREHRERKHTVSGGCALEGAIPLDAVLASRKPWNDVSFLRYSKRKPRDLSRERATRIDKIIRQRTRAGVFLCFMSSLRLSNLIFTRLPCPTCILHVHCIYSRFGPLLFAVAQLMWVRTRCAQHFHDFFLDHNHAQLEGTAVLPF
ncbi:hypothetical protein KP509_38G058900 [Ceratopteris richardii]|uniref:Uncharacterized protein n=1 Tax=Ceratopteris richardii TaxID=49495 RepID=A0A8T2Q5C3_CERRI|nr:hypothetical protein KP509_38G058900 [Ceratopteris richardii]